MNTIDLLKAANHWKGDTTMRANVKIASLEARAASRRLQEMELLGEPRPEWGLLLLACYGMLLVAFGSWVLA